MKKLLSNIAALFLLCLLAGTAYAQQTGTIVGNVEDVNGAPVSGIRVRLTGSALIGGAREVLTGAGGGFRFVELPPGTYALEASAQGFASSKQGGLKVDIGQTVELTFLMEAQQAEQVIKVRAKPQVDINRVQIGQSMGKKFLEDVPSGRSYQTSAELMPGVVSGGNPIINGGSEYGNQYLVDGVNTTDPTTNTFALNFNFDAIEELEVITGGFSPEYGNVSGGVINVVTRSGSNEFELDTSLYFRDSVLGLEGIDGEPRNFQDIQFNINLGGPIIKDKLWWFLSTEYDRSTAQLPALNGEQHPRRLFESFYWLGKLTFAPSTKNRFTLLLQADPTIIDNSDQDPTATPESETHQDQGGILASVRWDGLYDPLVLKLQVAYKYSSLDIFPQSRARSSSPFSVPGVFGFGRLSDKNSFGEVRGCLGRDDLADPDSFDTDNAGRPTGCSDNIQDDPQFGQGLHIDLDSGNVSGGSGSDVFIERTRIQFTGSAAYFLDDITDGLDMELKVGFDLALMNDTDTSSNPGGASVFFDLDQDGDGIADPYAARITSTDNNTLETSADGLVFAFFALDNIKIADRLLIQPGVRFEQSTYENFAGDPILDFFTVSPRLWFAYDPFADGMTKIHGGYALMYETGNLALSKFIGRSLATRLAFWDGDNYVEDPGNIQLQGGESGTTVDKDNLEPMSIDEIEIGIERAICENLSFDVTYIHRYTDNAWEDDETNLIWNQAGTDVIGSRDGTGQQVFNLTTTSAYRVYDALQISLNKRLADNWSFNGSYTLAFFEGSSNELLTGAYDNPRQNVYLDGWLLADHRHTVKAQFTYAFDWGLRIGLAGTYESGGPYNKLFLNDYDGDYTNRRARRGYDPGEDLNDPSDDKELRLPDLVTLDLRAAFSLKSATGVDLEIIAEVFNLLNASTPTLVEENAIETFGDVLNRQRPFQAALGIRYRL